MFLESQDDEEPQENEEEEEVSTSKENRNEDYDYLLGMTLWSLTLEKKNEMLKKRDEKVAELEILKKKSPSDLWIADLDALLAKVRILSLVYSGKVYLAALLQIFFLFIFIFSRIGTPVTCVSLMQTGEDRAKFVSPILVQTSRFWCGFSTQLQILARVETIIRNMVGILLSRKLFIENVY